MIRCLSTALGAMLVLAAPAAASAEPGHGPRNTDGTLTAFRDCFIASQEKASRPWGFVADDTGGGGRFSTIPGRDTYSPYTLTVREGAPGSGIALTGEVPAESGPDDCDSSGRLPRSFAHAHRSRALGQPFQGGLQASYPPHVLAGTHGSSPAKHRMSALGGKWTLAPRARWGSLALWFIGADPPR